MYVCVCVCVCVCVEGLLQLAIPLFFFISFSSRFLLSCNYKTHNTNTGRLCCSGTKGFFFNFLTSVHSDSRRKTQFLKVFSNQLCWLYPHARCILWCLRSLSVEIRKPQLHLQWPKSNSIPQMAENWTSLPPWSNLNSQQ